MKTIIVLASVVVLGAVDSLIDCCKLRAACQLAREALCRVEEHEMRVLQFRESVTGVCQVGLDLNDLGF